MTFLSIFGAIYDVITDWIAYKNDQKIRQTNISNNNKSMIFCSDHPPFSALLLHHYIVKTRRLRRKGKTITS